MTLRDAAIAAYEDSQNSQAEDARIVLADVLAPYDAVTLEVAHSETDQAAGWSLVIFTDGDVHLAVRTRSNDVAEVSLVADPEDAQGWTRLAEVTSLAQLGEVVHLDAPDEPEPTYPAWVQPTGAHDAYVLDDRVTHAGKAWESTANGNVWEPGVSGWREVA